jgi:hypothetical protein
MARRDPAKALLQAEVLVGNLVRARRGEDFSITSLHRSYGIAPERLREIITRNGGVAHG